MNIPPPLFPNLSGSVLASSSSLSGKREKVKDSFYHVKSFVYETYTTKIFKKYFYDAALGLIFRSAKTFKRVQAGRHPPLPLSYILATLVILILLVRVL